jgi:hypothetical protein
MMCSAYSWVLVLLVSFVVIYISHTVIITPGARFLDCLRLLLFIGFEFVLFDWLYSSLSMMGHRACCVFETPGM